MIRLIKGNVERIVLSEEQAKKLEANSFKRVTADEQTQPEKGTEDTKPSLEGLTVKELREMAKEKGIEAASSLNKEDLLKVLGGDNDGNQ